MENLRFLYFALICLVLSSCSFTPHMDFHITNSSNSIISNISISAFGSTEIDTIEFTNNNSVSFTLDMNNLPKTDGSYKIEFKRDGISESKSFGYYTNGYPLNRNYNLEITDDQIVIKEN